MPDERDSVELLNGKYTFVYQNAQVDVLRYGEPWIQAIPGANAVCALMHRVHELEAEVEKIHADRVRLADMLREQRALAANLGAEGT